MFRWLVPWKRMAARHAASDPEESDRNTADVDVRRWADDILGKSVRLRIERNLDRLGMDPTLSESEVLCVATEGNFVENSAFPALVISVASMGVATIGILVGLTEKASAALYLVLFLFAVIAIFGIVLIAFSSLFMLRHLAGVRVIVRRRDDLGELRSRPNGECSKTEDQIDD